MAKWSLDIGGLVSKPVRFSFEDLRAMPAIEQVQTLECISNEVGGDLISNAKWKGVSYVTSSCALEAPPPQRSK